MVNQSEQPLPPRMALARIAILLDEQNDILAEIRDLLKAKPYPAVNPQPSPGNPHNGQPPKCCTGCGKVIGNDSKYSTCWDCYQARPTCPVCKVSKHDPKYSMCFNCKESGASRPADPNEPPPHYATEEEQIDSLPW